MRSGAESKVLDVPALRMREATIVAAVPLTFGVAAVGSIYAGLTWERPHRLALVLLLTVAALSSVGVYRIREKIVRSRFREAFFLGWTLSDIGMLVVATTFWDGGTRSPLIIVFFIPVVFSAMSYPLASVVAVGTVSVVSFLLVALIAGGYDNGYPATFAYVLACTAAMSAWQADRHKRQHRLLATASRTDPLTGCLNRRGFEERAEAELADMGRHGRHAVLVAIDIDKFKPVNDVFGHAAGDELLCWVVQTLQSTVRGCDPVGRMGGDEFAVLLPETDAHQGQVSAARIAAALSERAPASIGLAVYPEDGADLETLARCADARLYATRHGRYPPAEAPRSEEEQAGEQAAVDRGAIDLWRAALEAMPEGDSGRDTHGGLDSVLLDQIDASVVATDMLGIVISWNRGAERLYGWTSEEAIGRPARELIVPEDATAAERLLAELSRDGRWDGELPVRRKDGTHFTAYVRNRLVTGADGRSRAIVGVAVDISKRVAAETELLQSRNFAQALTECMGEALLTFDLRGRITYINKAGAALLGSSEQELTGEPIVEVLSAPGADGRARAFADMPFARALSREVTVRVEEASFRTATGRELTVAYTATPFHTDEGLQGCVLVLQDVCGRKRLEAEHRRDAEKLACIHRVEDALAAERLVLHAQPIVDLRSGERVQNELLLRLLDADGRVVPPVEFLPVVEGTAIMGELDWWVIKQATRLAGEGAPVQANLSARSVGDPDVLDHIRRCVEQHRVAPGRLVFEITETAIVEDEQAARAFAEGLHQLGCEIALDDFGTGYGSLTYLKQMAVDYLKLDIEFVRDLVSNEASRHVVQAVVALAGDFGLLTVGEGVEDAATLELLRELGVDLAQGYHIARPEPFGELPGDGRAADGAGARPHRRAEGRTGGSRRGKRRPDGAGALSTR